MGYKNATPMGLSPVGGLEVQDVVMVAKQSTVLASKMQGIVVACGGGLVIVANASS